MNNFWLDRIESKAWRGKLFQALDLPKIVLEERRIFYIDVPECKSDEFVEKLRSILNRRGVNNDRNNRIYS